MKQNFKILETTLRDGSYTINYQFNGQETEYIAKILDEIGFEYIEIGPGIGFNADKFSQHPPAVTDENYIKAARAVVKNGKIGMFFIPGIAHEKNIDMASRNGLDLIRVGTNINEFDQGFKYLDLCKKNNIETASNLMKSYAVDAKEFARIANECSKAGADTVYLVDSAGGMFPEDISNFFYETKNINPDINLGFHGHDNLGLAISNTVAAIKSGAAIVDSSIRGMGRSSGNTITEKLLFVLKRMGYNIEYDIKKMLELSDKVILEYLHDKPERSLDLIYGFSQFHSSFIGVIKKYADIYNIDAKDLIIEYSKIDKLNIDESLAENIAQELSKKDSKVYSLKIERQVKKKSDIQEQLKVLCQTLKEQKHKYNKHVFFNISKAYDGDNSTVSPVIHDIENISFASAEVTNIEEAKSITENFEECLDGYLIDVRIAPIKSFNSFSNDNLYFYNDAELFANAILNYLENINIKTPLNPLFKVFLEERDEIIKEIYRLLPKKYSIVEKIESADIAVIGKGFYDYDKLKNYEKIQWIVITKSGVIEQDASSKITNCNFIRIGLEIELFNMIIETTNYRNLFDNLYGITEKEGEHFCSGGYIGKKGTIVVDNYKDINQKYGISKGDGSLKYFK
jgi:4-hydroxy-2-oxovalerate aldolase